MIRHFPTLQAAISALTQTGFVEVGRNVAQMYRTYIELTKCGFNMNGYRSAIAVYMNGATMATIHPVLGSSIVMVAYSEW